MSLSPGHKPSFVFSPACARRVAYGQTVQKLGFARLGREFKFWQNQTKSPTGRSAVRTCDWRHFERARTAAREARSVWVDQGSPEWNEHEASERPSTRSARPSFAIGHRLPFPSRLRVREGRRSRAGKAGGMKVMQRRILLALVAVLCAAIGVQGTSPSTTRSRDETPRRERDRDPRVDPPPT